MELLLNDMVHPGVLRVLLCFCRPPILLGALIGENSRTGAPKGDDGFFQGFREEKGWGQSAN